MRTAPGRMPATSRRPTSKQAARDEPGRVQPAGLVCADVAPAGSPAEAAEGALAGAAGGAPAEAAGGALAGAAGTEAAGAGPAGADPAGGDDQDYVDCARELSVLIGELVPRLV